MPEKTVNEIPREVRPLFTKAGDALARENFEYAIDLLMQVVVRAPEVFDVRQALRKAQQGRTFRGTSPRKKSPACRPKSRRPPLR